MCHEYLEKVNSIQNIYEKCILTIDIKQYDL